MARTHEGAVPTLLGTVVTGAGLALTELEIAPVIAAGVVGFGLAHIMLGTVDLLTHRR